MARKTIFVLAVMLVLTVALAGTALAADPHSGGGTGQPNQSCQVTTTTPGQAASAMGSAFNPGGVAGGVYAGTQSQNTINQHTFSQYDVACFQNTTNP
jgi:hypothetical protein